MPLFILALLALAAAAAEEEAEPSTPGPRLLPGPKGPIDPTLQDPQLKALFFWNYLDQKRGKAVHWNNLQATAWLLDTLVCPDGHADPEHFSYLDEIEVLASPMTLDESPTRAMHKHRYYYPCNNPIGPTLWCHHPDHNEELGSTLPDYVWKKIETGDGW